VINSIREMVMLPVSGLTGGAQPVMGFNYGAGKNERVKESIRFATVLGFAYICVVALVVLLFPKPLIGIFTSDANTIAVGAKMIHIYFFGIVFMSLQFAGQITFQALGFARQAVFFSMLRKVIIVVPFTLLLPAIGFGVNGVFMAEPISNVVGGIACFATMWHVVYKKL
ncbi:MAG: MATE family efflux transporter, partial [Oscillospiraceae bacterium]|nr:MATE family efflux transporter [Oscillospiraceae bacterium]